MNVPDAWEDEWSTAADERVQAQISEPKPLSTKQTKAQKRAAQAEFNRQLWAEAEGPRQTNYFLESRNVVPLRQEFKAAPVLLSRKGPITRKSRPTTIEGGLDTLTLNNKEESSEDEDEAAVQQRALDDAKVQAAKDREEKQRKYEERRLELFGPSSSGNNNAGRPSSRSGGSSPANLTPPGSRSATPQRGGKRGRGRGNHNGQPRVQLQQYQPYQQQQLREVYDPDYSAKPNTPFLMRREQGQDNPNKELRPLREPRHPDGSGRGGAGFVSARTTLTERPIQPPQNYQS